MILFVDDEKWIMSSLLDNFEYKAKSDERYNVKHFFFSVDALKFLEENKKDIEIIVLDIGMDFGDDRNEPIFGGVKLLQKLVEFRKTNNLSIVIFSVVKKELVEEQFGMSLEGISEFISRNDEECNAKLIEKIAELLSK